MHKSFCHFVVFVVYEYHYSLCYYTFGSMLTDKSAVYSQAPSIADLITHVAYKTPTKWYEIGALLNIEIATLNTFETQTSNSGRLWIMVFDQWKREQKVPFTWETIISTLEVVGENKTATDIREWLNK